MKYTYIDHVDKEVSRILYGTESKPFVDGEDGNELLDMVIGSGINTIDTARCYGFAEKSIGKWMRDRNNRKDIVILSKCAHPLEDGISRVNEKAIREDFDVSSGYLGTDYIDIYLLHRDDRKVPAGEVVEWMNQLHNEGKIGAFGGSNWCCQRIKEANEYAAAHNLIPFSVSSPNYGIAIQCAAPWIGECVSISGKEGYASQRWYSENKMPLIIYSPLGRGMFSGKVKSSEWEKAPEILDRFSIKGYYCDENRKRLQRCEEIAAEKGVSVSQIAVSWLMHKPQNVFTVISVHSSERMKMNADALDVELTQKELDYIADDSEAEARA